MPIPRAWSVEQRLPAAGALLAAAAAEPRIGTRGCISVHGASRPGVSHAPLLPRGKWQRSRGRDVLKDQAAGVVAGEASCGVFFPRAFCPRVLADRLMHFFLTFLRFVQPAGLLFLRRGGWRCVYRRDARDGALCGWLLAGALTFPAVAWVYLRGIACEPDGHSFRVTNAGKFIAFLSPRTMSDASDTECGTSLPGFLFDWFGAEAVGLAGLRFDALAILCMRISHTRQTSSGARACECR